MDRFFLGRTQKDTKRAGPNGENCPKRTGPFVPKERKR